MEYWNDGRMELWNYGKPQGKPQRGVILIVKLIIVIFERCSAPEYFYFEIYRPAIFTLRDWVSMLPKNKSLLVKPEKPYHPHQP